MPTTVMTNKALLFLLSSHTASDLILQIPQTDSSWKLLLDSQTLHLSFILTLWNRWSANMLSFSSKLSLQRFDLMYLKFWRLCCFCLSCIIRCVICVTWQASTPPLRTPAHSILSVTSSVIRLLHTVLLMIRTSAFCRMVAARPDRQTTRKRLQKNFKRRLKLGSRSYNNTSKCSFQVNLGLTDFVCKTYEIFQCCWFKVSFCVKSPPSLVAPQPVIHASWPAGKSWVGEGRQMGQMFWLRVTSLSSSIRAMSLS